MVKERNPIVVILLSFVTCGIYLLYWFYATSQELNEKGALETSAGMMLLFLFIPIVNIIAFWKHCKAVEALSGGEKSAGLLFVLWLIGLGFISQYMVQTELNKHATTA